MHVVFLSVYFFRIPEIWGKHGTGAHQNYSKNAVMSTRKLQNTSVIEVGTKITWKSISYSQKNKKNPTWLI